MVRHLQLIAVAALLASCAGAPSGAPVASWHELRYEGVVAQEYDLSCGAAALATVLAMHGDPVTEREIALALIGRAKYLDDPDALRAQLGFSLLDLKRAAEARGYEGVGYKGLALADLERLAPVIVPLDQGYPHFVVVRGLRPSGDGSGGHISFADPAWGNRTVRVERFERLWRSGIGFVVRRSFDGA